MPEAQVDRGWHPPTGPLGELTRASEERARASAGAVRALEAAVALLVPPPPFADALRAGPHVAVIAEIKRRSPSKGAINEGIRAPERAAAYVAGGAAALSVLTEPSRFGGSLEDLRAVRAAVDVPLLRKDFITDRVQLLEARVAGASAVLLIARALAPARLDALAAEAAALGLEVLVEVRDAEELARAVAVPGAVIGVNNRDLETLVIDDAVGAQLVPRVPAGRVAVHESGVTGAEGVARAAACGADAVLVGSVLSAAPDPVAAVRALARVARRPRG